ncbi:MAG: hypothetical protein LBC26_07265 [Oscillospiraceae bacterium]|nr:hypothetical protein [Oscillospiraceae bacterium]
MEAAVSPIVAAVPADARAASAMGVRVAHLAYDVDPACGLMRRRAELSARGGLMVLSDRAGGPAGQGAADGVGALCQAVVQTCAAHAFEGVVADFETPGHGRLEQFVAECAPVLEAKGLALYVSAEYAHCTRACRVVFPCAPVSGSVRDCLTAARERYGGRRLAPEWERLMCDITLPKAAGPGARLTPRALARLTAGRQVFFSQELCAHYLTYKGASGETHFVLYDDGQSLLKKLRLAAGLGVGEGFFLYPEVAELFAAGELAPRG